jgi:5-methylthioadenosine/S-adenosylhomocysteine deaminase
MASPPPLDYLIKDVFLLPSASSPNAWIDRGILGIQGDRIAVLEPCPSQDRLPPAREVLEAKGLLAMPGLINTHTHAAMTLFRGLADDLPLKEWLGRHIFPAEANHLDSESVYWGTLLACAEMLLSGTTTFADGYFFMDSVADAVLKSGLRAVLCQGILDFPLPDCKDPSQAISFAARFVERWQGASPLIQPGLFCHSPYTCSPRTLQAAKAVCREKNCLFFIHLSETSEEVFQVQSRYGERPVRHLESLELLDNQTVAVHAVHLEPSEIEILAQTGTGISHCPESNMKLAAGVAPVSDMVRRGVKIGLGTDGCASNNDLDLLREMGTAARLGKIRCSDPTVMGSRTVYNLATVGGSEVLGMVEKTGSLEIGKKADLVLIDLNKAHLTPLYDPCSHLVYSASGADVRTVFVDGRLVVKDRHIMNFDLEEVLTRIIAISRGIIPSSRNRLSG